MLFLRFYFGVVTAFAVAIVAFVFFFGRAAERALAGELEGVFAPAASTAARLARAKKAGENFEEALAEERRLLGVPLALVARSSPPIDAGALARLDRGEVVGLPDQLWVSIYVALPETDFVLRMGPVGRIQPLARGRAEVSIGLILAGLLIGVMLLVRRIDRRLRIIGNAADRFGGGELAARANVAGKDAIAQLASLVNGMAARIEGSITAQRELFAMVSHELRTPLQRLRFAVESTAGGVDRTPQISGDLSELDELIEELDTLTSIEDRKALELAPVDLAALAAERAEVFRSVARGISILVREPEMSCVVPANARFARRAIQNLIANALRHARSTVSVSFDREGTFVAIDVDDDGPGVAEESRALVFEPFVRLEGPRPSRGSGLGLAIVRRVMTEHGGNATVTTSPLGGARFRLLFPVGA